MKKFIIYYLNIIEHLGVVYVIKNLKLVKLDINQFSCF